MGSAQSAEQGMWLRCFDGQEMEYEYITDKELQPLFEKGLSNSEIVSSLGGAIMQDAEDILNEKRSKLTEKEF
ncbi:MAG: hypothetical protein GQ553_01550 [Nitrosomonadaceae bacterium]|nr:hypothetical protein [Nitrosomonadaceae bacterium]